MSLSNVDTGMPCDQHNTFKGMFELFMTRGDDRSSLSTPQLMCQKRKKRELIMEYSFFSKFIHHQYHIFPTAHCMSEHNKSAVTAYDGHEAEGDLRLPGMKTRYDPTTNTVGEFEINQLMITESGWDRVKHMYRTKSGKFEDEGTRILNTMFYRTALIGFFVSTMIGSLKVNKTEKSLSKVDAMRKGYASQVLVPKKILKSALKDTLKVSILSLSLLHLSQTISAYKNKTSFWEFTLSSAIGFGAVGLNQGPYKCGVLAIKGAVFGTVGGWLACQVLRSAGITQESRNLKRMQEKVEELRSQAETG